MGGGAGIRTASSRLDVAQDSSGLRNPAAVTENSTRLARER